MIADLKAYPEYKESGSSWLGRIPAHWNMPRLGSVLRERGETNEQKQVSQVLSVLKDVGVIRYEEKGNIGNKKSDDIGRYKIVRLDDIVVNCMNVIIGSVGRSRYTGCLSPVYYVLTRRFDADNSRYLAAVFSAKPFQLSLTRIGNGILSHRMRIPMELLKCEPFPVPPPSEQVAIVRFLDWANGRLERAIRAKRKVIALLNEQKQAIIHRAVTRGLDPSVPLKASAIPWLGEIPAHWEATKLYRVTDPERKIMYGIVLPGPDADIGVYIVKGGNCEDGRLRAECLSRTTTEIESGYVRSRLRGSDIVYAIRGSIGAAQIVPDELAGANLTQDAARIAPGPGILPQWLLFAVRSRSFFSKLEAGAVGATIRGINIRDLKRADLAIPPMEEQEQIAMFLLQRTGQVDTGISRLEREIELLGEYRTRLVADVVTGKLDVREVAARLPEEVTPAIPESDVAELSIGLEAADEEAVA
jgi:type I restriction enzyme, S subunit